MNLNTLEEKLEHHLFELESKGIRDPAHDLLHIKRVVNTAKQLAKVEGANLAVIVPSAWLHDLVNVAKDDPRRALASQLSAKASIELLKKWNYSSDYYNEIAHAIEAHSFSANIEAQTIEAKVVQDADRLDGLGAIGIARCFAVAGILKRSFYSQQDPFCELRAPDDKIYTIDHFYKKLFKIAQTMQTTSGKIEAAKRVEFMKSYLAHLKSEIGR